MQIELKLQDEVNPVFLWTENGTENIFKYNRLIFIVLCTPSCAISVLQKCAKGHKQVHPEEYLSIMQRF